LETNEDVEFPGSVIHLNDRYKLLQKDQCEEA